MDFILFGTLLLMVNVVISVLIALVIIHELYISKKFSKQNNFHFYNDLFSWEIFFLLITIENLMKILSDFLPINYEIYDLLLKIRILLLFFPFWNKIIHLERIMNKITYKRHYFVGIIPSIIVLILSFTGLPNIILIWILISSSLVPYLLLLIFLKNYGTSKIKSFKIILGVIFVGLGCIFKPEILMLEIFNIISPILLILGSIVILDSFRKEIIV
ncbi:MAG: hypothetical protein ACFE8G_03030 [Candidatus Hermodarchaeota archaeon]